MITIFGVKLSYNKQIFIALTDIYGIGISRALLICKSCNINIHKKLKDLNYQQLDKIKNNLSKILIENDLRKEVYFNIKRLIDLKCYRGLRHFKNLPSRGQRTRTNAKTRKKLSFNIKHD